jgi:hypothetical protein
MVRKAAALDVKLTRECLSTAALECSLLRPSDDHTMIRRPDAFLRRCGQSAKTSNGPVRRASAKLVVVAAAPRSRRGRRPDPPHPAIAHIDRLVHSFRSEAATPFDDRRGGPAGCMPNIHKLILICHILLVTHLNVDYV